MSQRIRKAVFPVAGLGTRFLPATKAMPKEMLTVVDRPVIQYAVDEARAAGIEHFIFVTGRNKGVIEDHFDVQVELEATLEERGKTEALEELRKDLPPAGSSSFTRQQFPLGLGHAVWCARDLVGNEPFALLLPDMVMKAETPCLANMCSLYERTGGNILSVEQCAPELTHRYGIVGVGDDVADGGGSAFKISEMVEKPDPSVAPSNLFINGRYILQPEIFDILSRQKAGAGNEIQITDAMVELMSEQSFFGQEFHGQTFDCGSKVGFLAANVAFALDREDIESGFRAELDTILGL